MKSKEKRLGAFTLVEFIIVTAIVGILSIVGAVRYAGAIEKARRSEAYAMLSQIRAAERNYYLENGAYTTSWSDLETFGPTAPGSTYFSYSLNGTGIGSCAVADSSGTDYRVCYNSGALSTGSNCGGC